MKKQAVILAAGKGTRMGDLTTNIPKPLIEINGKPFISYIIDNLVKAGYERIAFIVGYKKEQIISYLEREYSELEKIIIPQDNPQGTGQAVGLVQQYFDGNFLVIGGDHIISPNDITGLNFEDNFNYVSALNHPEPQHFGVLKVKGEVLVGIEEKPAHPSSNLINISLYKFTPEIFAALKRINLSPRGEYEITDAITLLASQKKVRVRPLQDYFIDLGKKEDLPVVEKQVRQYF